MENRIRIRKVPIVGLVDVLQELYNRGVDYIDIMGDIVDGQDTIGISFSKSYMNDEYMDDFDSMGEEQLPSNVQVKLSDDDLNQLI